MNFLLPTVALCLVWGLTTGCNFCISESVDWADATISEDKGRICSAGYTYRECLGSDCSIVDTVTEILNQQGCGSERVWMSASSLLLTVVLTKIFL